MSEIDQTMSDDRLARLERALPKLKSALEQKRLGIALQQAENVLRPFDGQRQQLEALTDAASLLLDYVELSRRDLEDIADEVEEIAGEMEEADSELELTGITRSFPNLSARIIPRYNRAIVAMLSRYTTRELSSLGALGRLLVKIGAMEVGNKLQALEQHAKHLESTSPSLLGPGIRAIKEEKTSTQAELKAFTKEPAVDAFLLALSRGQATLGLVTPNVLDWLNGLDASEQFRVSSV